MARHSGESQGLANTRGSLCARVTSTGEIGLGLCGLAGAWTVTMSISGATDQLSLPSVVILWIAAGIILMASCRHGEPFLADAAMETTFVNGSDESLRFDWQYEGGKLLQGDRVPPRVGT